MSEIELHRKLLGDAVRNRAIHAALKMLITPGKTTVADIGAGTGFLSFLARTLGAKSCDLYEYSGTLELARELARGNRITGLRFINAHSGEVANPPKVDLVVAEILGNFALEEGLLETLNDARRFLKPGGRLMPSGLAQFVAPVVKARLQDSIDVWPSVGYDINLSAAREVSLNNMYVKGVEPSDLRGKQDVREWDRIAFQATGKLASSQRRATVTWDKPPKAVHGFALWWEAELVPGVVLSTSPFEAATHWEQIYLPLLEPFNPRAGEQLELELRSDTERDVRLRWSVRLRKAGRTLKSLGQDSYRGRL